MDSGIILLLFTLVQNLRDGIEVYDVNKLEKLKGNNVLVLNVKVGKEFYLMLKGDSMNGFKWKCTNYEEINDALDDFVQKGESWTYDNYANGLFVPLRKTESYTLEYFKFKALKPSINQIVLKFSLFGQFTKYRELAVRININK